MLNRRLQILIDAERYSRVEARANETGASVAMVIRDAIDQALPPRDRRRERAARRILAAPPMALGSPEELER